MFLRGPLLLLVPKVEKPDDGANEVSEEVPKQGEEDEQGSSKFVA